MAHLTPVADPPPDRPLYSLSKAAEMTGVSQSTMKRRLRAGALPGAVQDDTGAWVIGVDDLLAAGFHLNRSNPVAPVSGPGQDESPQVNDLGQRIADLERQLLEERHARLTEQIRREAAEQIAAEREKRAQTAERALLMLESRDAPAPMAADTLPAAAGAATAPEGIATTVASAPVNPPAPKKRWWRR